MAQTKLTDIAVKQAAPGATVRKMADGQGLSLEIHPNGGKYWRYRFRDAADKEQKIGLGTYPGVSLKQAREAHQKLREDKKAGYNPAVARKVARFADGENARNTFEALARDWHADRAKSKWTADNAGEILRRMENHLFPVIGSIPIASLDPQRVLRTVKAIEASGTVETAHRALQYIGQALRWGVQHGRASRDFTPDLRGALASAGDRHHNRIALADIPTLLQDLNAANLYSVTRFAIDWLFLTACRTGEMRGATWAEIDIDRGRWVIPAERMKMGSQHIVPLSRQAISTLESMQALGLTRAPTEFIFPAMQHQARMMSENTIGYAFNRAGYAGRQTPHGIRGLFSTAANESALWKFEDIELALAHQTGNSVSRAYNSAQRIPERARLLQWWADELDRMREGKPEAGATVIAFPAKTA
jgi:integrase